MKKVLVAVWFLCASLFAQEQILQPDPDTGRPLLIQSMDGMRWESPILVFSDSDENVFVGQDSIIASAPMFDRDGKFFVYLYTQYKNDYPCKKMFTAEQKAKIPNFSQICTLLGYKLRWLDVDTRAHRARGPMQFLIDTDGKIDTPIKGSEQWSSTDSLAKDSWLRAAIKQVSERLQREIQKEKLKGQF